MLKTLGRLHAVQNAVGFIVAKYFRLVGATTRFVTEPADCAETLALEVPFIVAMWHGQHFLTHVAQFGRLGVSVLISRHGDGEINAVIARRLGVALIRGSGGSREKMQKRGGVAALREMLRALASGSIVALTADVPKISRRAGEGIVALARLSGRPIYPLAVVTTSRIDLNSWDQASVPLPFGRGAIVFGEPIRVARDADRPALEAARRAVESGLDRAHGRAYALARTGKAGLRKRH
jgi:lysophospholipid acyltransferase (LPLAT)-like uncharacterized protein